MIKLDWEAMDNSNLSGYMWRTKVFGGWLVKNVDDVTTYFDYGEGGIDRKDGFEWRSSITFVPDPEHKWKK